ncbi:2-methylcitrate dehydratase [Geomonas silvestris]|uniref:2-methylcitrate dehydratase n=1 Tax=Geomonas silvestris TaxID=2740184 RepID=A0A6V8MFC3_9BACT|nr:bifunctional 2-methylcitrate dehydratase/aconitate hydratase [Geomonas silvestris]GFO58632.1 2-methylcitrate dehydratase [Geomonas silvestris]
MTTADQNLRPEPDPELAAIADYLCAPWRPSPEALTTARYALLDSLGCAALALDFPECARLVGPLVPGATLHGGARVPGTRYELDPVQAAFSTGALIRWLDFNDTWLAAEWGHPSDNLAALLAVGDYLSRSRLASGRLPILMGELLARLVQAYEIQGVLALENGFNRVGLDHVLLVKLASAGVAARLLGGSREQVIAAVSQVFVDGQSLRTYRHAPNTGSRKSWAAGDAASRGVRLALLTLAGEEGYPSAISAPTWGFSAVSFKGERLRLPRPLQSYVMENILFKVAYPAEFHAQTAVEAAVALHPTLAGRLEEIDRVLVATQESAVRIISKTGPLYNPADRDHCLQYMVAIGLIYGELNAGHYTDRVAGDPRIDELRGKMEVREEPRYSRDYLDPEKRSIANAVQVVFKDGSKSEEVEVEYPLGHRRRRAEGVPLLLDKARANLARRFPEKRVCELVELCLDGERLEGTGVSEFMDLLVP